MRNLLVETKEDIQLSGHTVEDIVFIGSDDSRYQCTWDEFCKLADHEYCAGFGAQKVAQDLIIVFSDGSTMWRSEYDGSEQWEFSKPFTRQTETKPIRYLFGEYWPSLADLHNPDQASHQSPR